jgi:hypothetical protein
MQIANVLSIVGVQELAAGRLALARERVEKALRLFREFGNSRRIVVMLINLGRAPHLAGDDAEAKSLLGEALGGARQLGDRECVLYALNGLAITATSSGEPDADGGCAQDEERYVIAAAMLPVVLGRRACSKGIHDRTLQRTDRRSRPAAGTASATNRERDELFRRERSVRARNLGRPCMARAANGLRTGGGLPEVDSRFGVATASHYVGAEAAALSPRCSADGVGGSARVRV